MDILSAVPGRSTNTYTLTMNIKTLLLAWMPVLFLGTALFRSPPEACFPRKAPEKRALIGLIIFPIVVVAGGLALTGQSASISIRFVACAVSFF